MAATAVASAITAEDVLARQTFVESTIRFVDRVLEQDSIVLRRKVHPNHTFLARELKGFKGFSFLLEGEYTQFGGSMLKVWDGPRLVLHVEWHEEKECKVKVFVDAFGWQTRLTRLAEDAEATLVALEAGTKAGRDAEAAKHKRRERLAEIERSLGENAKRLAFT